MDAPDDTTREVDRALFDGEHRLDTRDTVVREEPLEIRIAGVSIAVVMRTPGHDLELARGFAVTERIVEDPQDIVSVRHCDRVEVPEAEDNVVQLVLAPTVEVDLVRLRRNLFASSSCGVCGKASIATAMATAGPITTEATIAIDVLRSLPDRLRTEQRVFDRTGGLHGAGLFELDGTALVVREDVGRHNALDKLVGWAVERQTWPLPACALAVSGRVSFEIVQKALAARIPFIVAVSAPSSLAIALAEQGGVTLAAFVRGDKASVYSHAARIH